MSIVAALSSVPIELRAASDETLARRDFSEAPRRELRMGDPPAICTHVLMADQLFTPPWLADQVTDPAIHHDAVRAHRSLTHPRVRPRGKP